MAMVSISPSSVAIPPIFSGFNASSQTTNLAPTLSPPSPTVIFSAPPPESSQPPLPPADIQPPPPGLSAPPPTEASSSPSPPAEVSSSPPPLPPAVDPPPLPVSPPAPPSALDAPPTGSPPSTPILSAPPIAAVPPSIESPTPPFPPPLSASPPSSPLTNPPPDAASTSPPPVPPSPVSHATSHSPPPPSPHQPETGSPPTTPSPTESPSPPSPVSHSTRQIPQPGAPSPTSTSTSSPPPPPPPVSPIPPVRSSSVDGRMQPSPPSATDESGFNRTAAVTRTSSGRQGAGVIATLLSFVCILALSLFIVAVWYNRRRRRRKRFDISHLDTSPFASSQNSASSFQKLNSSAKLAGSGASNNFLGSSEHSLRSSKGWFTYEELSDATNEFSSYNILGEGGFGCVYKGVLSDGRQVAVKRLKDGSGQGEREFKAEVETISRVHHRHLVSMVGYCIAENQRLLVYDYVPNNTLYYHLHGENKPVMKWASRVKVAAGAARGIAYLHEDCQPRIIHRDIKSTNILLDNNFEAQVADFGLAKLAMELELYTHVSTRVMGTFGYLAPEYASTGKLTEKSDVFSFGVVLLELITGRKPVDSSQPLGDESLVEWSRPLLAQAIETNTFDGLVDPKLGNDFVATEMYLMIEVAAVCVRHSASRRPKMSQIVRAFDSMDAMADLNNGMKPGQSGIIDSREHSAQIRLLQRMAFGVSPDSSSDVFDHSENIWRTH